VQELLFEVAAREAAKEMPTADTARWKARVNVPGRTAEMGRHPAQPEAPEHLDWAALDQVAKGMAVKAAVPAVEQVVRAPVAAASRA
jgi:hypothetical protein